MNAAQKRLRELQERQSKHRQRMSEISQAAELTDELRSELDTIEQDTPDLERQIRAATVALDEEERAELVESSQNRAPDGETRERDELRSRAQLHRYIDFAVESRAADGAEAELNAALKLPGNRFPLEILAPLEMRATTNVDAGTAQAPWLDRLFAETAAARLGVTMRSVAPGVQSFPVTTAGAAADQLGRGEVASDAAWTVSVTEIKPTRNTVRAVFSDEDAMRLPGLEDALRRDLGMALTEGIDRTIFLGDTGANEDAADITGLNAATGITEATLTQGNKVKGPETLAAFIGWLDGKAATELSDLNIVTSVAANKLWHENLVSGSTEGLTVARFLKESGLMWSSRGELEDSATGNGKFGAFVGRKKGIEGAGVAAIWNSGMLIRDPYTAAAKGECALTLSYFWGLAFPRPANFARLKFVT